MEVETRVSVQAMRGKFEQKPEDSQNLCTPSPASKPTTPPGRARASSLIIKDGSCDKAVSGERLTNSVDKENESRTTKHSPSNISKTKSIFSDIVSPILTGSKVTKAFSPKKHSVDNAKGRKISSETCEVTDNSSKVTPSRKYSENFSAEAKPSVVRRIPVFKSFNGGPCSDDKIDAKNEPNAEPKVETTSRREKFLGHIRSRSQGNFMIKRDPSVERNGSFTNNSESVTKPENGNSTDLFGKKCRQKSSDNLFGHRDSKSSSPFEGKQKIVANVVKNMKNKEKPKVLRKFSFSSKIEKEIKNKKEKASPNKTNEGKMRKPSPGFVPCTAKMEAIAKLTVKERRSSFAGTTTGPGTVSVAKAVAEIALVRSSNRSPESSDNAVSPGEVSPPSRPPRRRSAVSSGLSSHKKGMAPSPPGPPLSQHINKIEAASSQSHGCYLVSVTPPEQGPSLDTEGKRNQSSPNLYLSSESLVSPQSSDVSRENSPVMISQNSPLLQKHKSKSKINVTDVDKSYSEGYCTCDEEKESKKGFAKPAISKKPEMEDKEQPEVEFLPAGPPPKKPPRTFAYDIYRSGNSKSEDDVISKENGDSNENVEMSTPPPGPIYAIPMKKKKTENKLTPKPPVRSNSDLSKRDLIKPSVAPKPHHILNKVKRASVVDPLSCAEKGEDAAMTSEFQRQAHIRYSLRRPKKPPPAPPPNSESDTSILSDSVSNSKVTKALAKSYTGLNQNFYSSDNDYVCGSSPQLLNDRCSPTDSLDITTNSRCTPDSIYQSVTSDDTEDGETNTPSFRLTSRSSYNLHVPTGFEGNQPLSLGHCPTDTSSELTGLYRKRSMSDETLYRGSKYGEEPIYALPIFANNKGSRGHNRQRELHYMCSVLFTDEETDAGRDGGRRNGRDGDTADGSKVKSSIISAWKKEFRQSCRQVQNKIKKTVNR